VSGSSEERTIFKKFDVTPGLTYGGFCYDGPWEGQWRRSDYHVIECHHLNRTGYAYGLDPVAGHIHIIYYRWSDPLRAWVALNMR
jgi:hypothetical protein